MNIECGVDLDMLAEMMVTIIMTIEVTPEIRGTSARIFTTSSPHY